jgi:copper chaperone CopZ
MRVPQAAVPILVVLFALAGLGSARFLVVPTLTRDYAADAGSSRRTVSFLVDGVRCRDTAERAFTHLDGLEGIARAEAFASRNEIRVTFDPGRTGAQAIREALEGPEFDAATGEIWFGRFRVIEMDGVPPPEGTGSASPGAP